MFRLQHPIDEVSSSLPICNPSPRFVISEFEDQAINRLHFVPSPQKEPAEIGNDVWIGGKVMLVRGYNDVALSSWTTEASVGDYLPRLTFAATASVFGRVVVGGDSAILPWRPQRETPMAEEALLAAEIVPLGRIEFVEGRLRGRTPSEARLRESCLAEMAGHHA